MADGWLQMQTIATIRYFTLAFLMGAWFMDSKRCNSIVIANAFVVCPNDGVVPSEGWIVHRLVSSLQKAG